MWWLYVLLGIAALITAILVWPVRLILTLGEKNTITFRVLFVKWLLYPSAPKKSAKKKNPKKRSAERKPAPTKSSDNADEALNMIGLIKNIVIDILHRIKTYVRVTLKQLHIVIGTDEAARTAQLYGAAAVAYDELSEILRRNINYREKRGAVSISADFTSEKTEFSAILELRSNLIGALKIILPAMIKNINKT